MNNGAKKSNEILSRKEISKESLMNESVTGHMNEGEMNILGELDFEVAMAESKELVEIVLQQNNTHEMRKLRRRLWRLEKAWEALMRWIHSLKDSEEEREEEDNKTPQVSGFLELENSSKPDPFIMVLLSGLPKQLETSELIEEIHRNVDCGDLTLHQLSRGLKKSDHTVSCEEEENNNWVIKLPRFIGKRIIEAQKVTIQNQVVLAKEFVDSLQCYRCWRFGHYASQCQRATRCKFCAGFHHHKSCTSKGWRCVNCTDQGFNEADTHHIVTANQCPLRRTYFNKNKIAQLHKRDSVNLFELEQ